MSLEELILEHERTVVVKVTRCAGPGCSCVRREQALWLERRARGDFEAFTSDSRDGWYWLGALGQENVSQEGWEFCSFTCVRQFMLGKDAP